MVRPKNAGFPAKNSLAFRQLYAFTSILRIAMSTFFERIGQFRRQLGEMEPRSWGERVRIAREQLLETQRILMDASTHGSLDHSRNLATWHARLEVPMDASTDEVTAAFRRMIRIYHPDLYAADPNYAAMATELTQLLVTAYRGILSHRGQR